MSVERKNDAVDGDEISLLDLFAVLLKYKKLIIINTLFAAVFVVIYSLISIKLPPEKSFMPNVYTASASMLINDVSKQSNLIPSGLSDLAGMAGVSGTSSYGNLAVYMASTNSFLDAIVDRFDIIKKYEIKQSPRTSSRKIIKSSLKVKLDKDSGVFSISFTNIDPVFAQAVVQYTVEYYEKRFIEIGLDKHKPELKDLADLIETSLKGIKDAEDKVQNLERNVSYVNANNLPAVSKEIAHARREVAVQEQIYANTKAQYELLKVKMQSEKPLFQILELPEIPEQKSGPSRGKLCIIVTFAVFFLSIFMAFLLNAIKTIKNDPNAMSKLKGKAY